MSESFDVFKLLRLLCKCLICKLCRVSRFALTLAGGGSGSFACCVYCFSLGMRSVVFAYSLRSAGLVVITPRVGGIAPVMTESGNVRQLLLLACKSLVCKLCRVCSYTLVLAGCGSCDLTRGLYRFLFNMRSVVFAYSLCGAGLVVGAPCVGRSVPLMTGSRCGLEFLCLLCKRITCKLCRVYELARILARCIELGDYGIYSFFLNMRSVVSAYSLCRAGLVVIAPGVGCSAPVMTESLNIFKNLGLSCKALVCKLCRVRRFAHALARCGSCNLACRVYGFCFNMRNVSLVNPLCRTGFVVGAPGICRLAPYVRR